MEVQHVPNASHFPGEGVTFQDVISISGRQITVAHNGYKGEGRGFQFRICMTFTRILCYTIVPLKQLFIRYASILQDTRNSTVPTQFMESMLVIVRVSLHA